MSINCRNQIGIKLAVNVKNIIRLIELESITYLTCDGYVTTLYFINQKRISTSKLLKQFENELKCYGFIRINHNTIINSKHILKVEFSTNRKIVYINDSEIVVSRRKAQLLKKNLKMELYE